MIFRSERLYTRFFSMEDLDVFYRLNGDEEIVRYIREPKSYEECRVFLEQVIEWYKDLPVNWRVAVADLSTDKVIGMFAVIPVNGTDERQIGYSFLKPHWGQGYASEITQAGTAYVFSELGFDAIAAITQPANKASCKVLQKCGFVLTREYSQEGKLLLEFKQSRSGNC